MRRKFLTVDFSKNPHTPTVWFDRAEEVQEGKADPEARIGAFTVDAVAQFPLAEDNAVITRDNEILRGNAGAKYLLNMGAV